MFSRSSEIILRLFLHHCDHLNFYFYLNLTSVAIQQGLSSLLLLQNRRCHAVDQKETFLLIFPATSVACLLTRHTQVLEFHLVVCKITTTILASEEIERLSSLNNWTSQRKSLKRLTILIWQQGNEWLPRRVFQRLEYRYET